MGSAVANQSELAHNNTYGPLPFFYVDKLVVCRDVVKKKYGPHSNKSGGMKSLKEILTPLPLSVEHVGKRIKNEKLLQERSIWTEWRKKKKGQHIKGLHGIAAKSAAPRETCRYV